MALDSSNRMAAYNLVSIVQYSIIEYSIVLERERGGGTAVLLSRWGAMSREHTPAPPSPTRFLYYSTVHYGSLCIKYFCFDVVWSW